MKVPRLFPLSKIGLANAVAIVALFLSASAHSAIAATKIALVVGNAQYPKQTLATPENDARLMAQAFERKGYKVVFLRNTNSNTFRKALRNFQKSAERASISVLYFSGLAIRQGSENYILPVGAAFRSPKDIPRYGVAVGRLMRMKTNGATALILDARAPRKGTLPFSHQSGLAALSIPARKLVVYSAKPGHWPLRAKGGEGRFARTLANLLQSKGTGLETALRRTRKIVERATKGRQSPWYAGTLRSKVKLGAIQSLSKQRAKAVANKPKPQKPNIGTQSSGGRIVGYLDSKGRFHNKPPGNAGSVASHAAPSMSANDLQRQAEARRRMDAELRRQYERKKQQAAAERRMQQSASKSARREQATKAAELSAIKRPKETNRLAADRRVRRQSAVAKAARPRQSASPPRPSAPAPMKPAAVTRYPTLESPEEVPVGQSFAVQVSLTLDEITPDVKVRPGKGAAKTKDGALAMALHNAEEWNIDVILSAPGFKIEGARNRQTITLPRDDDSSPALFNITARPIAARQKARKLYATLWHKGSYLAKVIKPILVLGSAAAETASASRAAGRSTQHSQASSPAVSTQPHQAKPAALTATNEPPQLTVYILHDLDGEGGQSGQIIVNSPFLQPTVEPYSAPTDMKDWLTSQYDRLLDVLAERSEIPLPERTVPLMRGLGLSVYNYFAPESFKAAFWRLSKKLGPKFNSIQIYTNDPILPWELLRPVSADQKTQRDFIGLEFRIARWHIGNDSAQLDKPPQRLEIKELVAIAPQYKGDKILPNQAREMRVLEKLPGFRLLTGKLASMRTLLKDFPTGIIHFSGHGTVSDEDNPNYAIRLEDIELDVMTWRGMASPARRNHPFIFMNACDIGKAQRVANFVDGWAPAVLETGAGGYVGGLWPLSDSAAAGFSNAFYTRLYDRLRRGPVKAADLLRFARRDFLKTGDPTYLAYAYYGDVNLRFVRN